ncbi:MAG: AraC family transcriptional regulator [Pseudomonadales bacterium]|nr:AraC family transcriptional regulator [Pseudomonadales bacterium]
MNKRPALGLIYTLEALKNQDVDIEKALKKQGIKNASLDPSANIAITKELAILSEIVKVLPHPSFGISMGANFSLSGYGSFGMLLISCKDAFDAIKAGIQYQQLTYLYGTLSFEIGKHESALSYHPNHLPSYLKKFIIDRDISGTYRLIEELQSFMKTELTVKELCLPYAEPKDLTPFQERYPFPIKFGSKTARFLIANEDLHRAFPSASDTAFELYKSQCDEQVKLLSADSNSLTEEIKSHLALFMNNYPNADEVAKTLGLSERSLRRKLNSEGNSYQQLLDASKYEKAQQYLKQVDYSIDDIAERLGYTESGSFIRAFQRWAGETPAKYRKAQANK